MNIVDTRSFRFKEEKDMIQLSIIHPILLFIFADFNFYCYERDLPVVITRAVAHEIDGVSTSKTHSEGRAIDLSVKGWSPDDIHRMIYYFNAKYKDMAAISSSDGIPRLFIYHNVNLGHHLHFQVKRFTRRED